MDYHRRRAIAKGELSRRYTYLEIIKTLDLELQEIDLQHDHAPAISYEKDSSCGGKPNDEKLAVMITKKMMMERERESYFLKLSSLDSKLHISELPAKAKKVMDSVFQYGTYAEAGKKLGYSKTQIYRIMEAVYEHIECYL